MLFYLGLTFCSGARSESFLSLRRGSWVYDDYEVTNQKNKTLYPLMTVGALVAQTHTHTHYPLKVRRK